MRKPSEQSCANYQVEEARAIFLTLNLIANKWAIRLLFSLSHAENRTLRFGALQKAMEGISQRELTRHLREFEASGIVQRRIYAEVPPRVEYRLTDIGMTLKKPIQALSDWALEHGANIQEHRQNFSGALKAKEE